MTVEDARLHLAWLMWCMSEGYDNEEDRTLPGMTNWLLDDPATLHPDDQALRPHLLAMAAEVLKAIPAETEDAALAAWYEWSVRP